MKRVLLIFLSLVLALVGWSAVGAEDGFYVIPTMKVVPKTGQIDNLWHERRRDLEEGRGLAFPSVYRQ